MMTKAEIIACAYEANEHNMNALFKQNKLIHCGIIFIICTQIGILISLWVNVWK